MARCALMAESYRGWEIIDSLPDGWTVEGTQHASPMPGTVFVTDGVSPVRGGKRALMRLSPLRKKPHACVEFSHDIWERNNSREVVIGRSVASAANQLARKQMQVRLLSDIKMDLLICEIEQLDKTEYIRELREILDSIDI